MKKPLQSRSRDSAARVLDAVLTILDRDGMAAVTTARVAQESGISNGSIYHRFGTRHELLLGALDRFTTKLRADVASMREALPGAPEDLDAALNLVIAGYLAIFDAHGTLIRAFFVDSLMDADMARQGEADKTLFAEQVADFLSPFRSEITATPPELAFEMVHRLLFGYFMMRTLFHDDAGDQLMIRMLANAVRGILTGDPPTMHTSEEQTPLR